MLKSQRDGVLAKQRCFDRLSLARSCHFWQNVNSPVATLTRGVKAYSGFSKVGHQPFSDSHCCVRERISCFSNSGVERTTGPPRKAGAEPHFASLGKIATTSQRILLFQHDAACGSERSALSCFATRWLLSQNCIALESRIRCMTKRLGRDQSVGRIGSQTTKTRKSSERFCFSIWSIAEAPRKQTGQVGETSKSTRSSFAALSNCPVNWAKLPSLREINPVPDGPHRYQPPSRRRATAMSNSKFLVFTLRIYHPARRLAATCGNSASTRTMAVAIQKIMTLSLLRL